MPVPEPTVHHHDAPETPPGTDTTIDILGPLRLTVGGTASTPTSSRSRTFLALLALNPGRQVSLYAFADAIWGERLPQNPRRAVQLCAVRVRAHLDRLGATDLVVTRPEGYLLDLAPEHTDLGRVAALTRAADAAADTDAELAAVTSALALWRGEALADVASDVLQREVAPGLREQRLQLTERRIDILLRGDAAGLVDELLTLTARHPLRERLWGQLMRALHRDGRRGEALTAYHTVARRLRDELGLDPGAELKTLHASILTGQAEAAAALRVPRELPSDPVAFTGRSAELAELDKLLVAVDKSSGPVIAVVSGTGGVGKTSLAVHWARRVAEDFPDGQLFANLRGYHPEQALTPRRVLTRFLRTLGVRGRDIPDDADELTARYRSVMDGRRMLIVLDNVTDSDQARPLLPSSPGCLVLITSRDVLLSLIAAEGARQIGMDLPSAADARRMLAERLGHDRLDTEPGAADEIIAASARLPLALAIAAARAVIDRDTSLGAVAEQLRSGLDAFDTASALTDVRAVFSWSYRALSPAAARLLRLLGLHPGPDVSAAATASLAGQSLRRVDRLLAELVRAHLVIEQVPGRYALHDLMREYCVELSHSSETEADRDRAIRRVVDHYLHTAYTAAVTINPLRTELEPDAMSPAVRPEPIADYDGAMGWFDAEQDVLLAVLDRAADAGLDRRVWQLVRAVAGYLNRRSNWTQWIECYRAALSAAERLGEPVPQADAHRGLGRAYARKSRNEDAHRHFTKAMELYGDAGDLRGQARVESHLAMLHEQQGRYPQGVEHALRSLELLERLDDRLGYADALGVVAWCYTKVGEYRLTLDRGRQAVAAYQELDAPDGAAAAHDTIGYALHQLGEFSQAIDSYEQSIRLNRRLGDRYFVAISLMNLGDTHQALGDLDAAHEVWREAETILDELQHPDVATVRAKLTGAAAKPEPT